MYNFIKNFPAQLEAALSLIDNSSLLKKAKLSIQHVAIGGMGGSGIAGLIIQKCFHKEIKYPSAIIHDNNLPGYVDQHTLLLIASYSGNTKETIHMLQEGVKRNSKIVCITTGGKISNFIRENKDIDYLLLPTGMPPRTCLGYSLVQQLFILQFHKIIQFNFNTLKQGIALLYREQAMLQQMAKKVAQQLHKKIPIIYTTIDYEGVAIRFRQQLNENSKQLCWHHVVPEMNHNEIAAWENSYKKGAIVILYPTRIATDFLLWDTQKILEKKATTLIPLHAKGDAPMERTLYLIHLCDWISYYLALLKNVDPLTTRLIEGLKRSKKIIGICLLFF